MHPADPRMQATRAQGQLVLVASCVLVLPSTH